MAPSRFLVFLSLFTTLIFSSSPVLAQTCKNNTFDASHKVVYTACSDLPYTSSFLHWNYNSSSKTVQIAYRHTNLTPRKWVAWAINPNATGMIGSQAFVAYQLSDGSLKVYKTSVDSYQTTLPEGELSFEVSDLSATYSNNSIITIFATFQNPSNASTTLNQVWQEGPVVGDAPLPHIPAAPYINTKTTLDLLFNGNSQAPSPPPEVSSPPPTKSGTSAPPPTKSGPSAAPPPPNSGTSKQTKQNASYYLLGIICYFIISYTNNMII